MLTSGAKAVIKDYSGAAKGTVAGVVCMARV